MYKDVSNYGEGVRDMLESSVPPKVEWKRNEQNEQKRETD